MNDHYYSVNPTSEHDVRRITAQIYGRSLAFDTDAGVFSRDGLDVGTRVLLEALPELSGRVLDLGCGWGPVGVALLARNPELQVQMTDVNSRAVALSRSNLDLNRVSASVVQGDAFENVTGKFSAVITNPPIRAGKTAVYQMFAAAREYLEPDGALFIVIRKQQGAPSALKYLREIYASAEVIEREAGFWVIRAQMREA